MTKNISTTILLFWCSAAVYSFVPSHTTSPLSRAPCSTTSKTTQVFSTTTLPATIPNPLKKLPWNVQKEKERQGRKLKLERSQLHRELGIAEDATYEEIVEATDRLISRAGDDIKAKIKVEVAKDKILQIRLNERLAGLATATKDARAQSSFEYDGADEEVVPKKKEDAEWQAPRWTQGLVIKPDEKQITSQARLWGGLTIAGFAFPPALDYLNRFTWLVCIAQLTFRGMPRNELGGGGLGIDFNAGGGGKSHMKVAWLLGITVSFVGAGLVYGLMPAWAKGQRYTPLLAFTLRNVIYGVSCSYLQPYKG